MLRSETNVQDPAMPSDTSTGTHLGQVKQELDFRCLADCVPGCILVADAKGQIVYANKHVVAALGCSMKDLLWEGWLASLDPAFLGASRSKWFHCVQTNEPLDVTWKFRWHDGTYRWHHLKAQPIELEECKTVRWYVLGVDVDEQLKVQEALRASEQEAREILDRVPAMISTRTEDGIAYTNKRLSDYVGAVITNLWDGSYLNYIHPDDREAIVHQHINSAEKTPNDTIYRLRGKDGIYRWFHTRAEPFFNEDGSVYRWYALNSDIDDLYRSRELLKEREFQLNLLTENLPAVLFKAAPDGTITYVNQRAIDYSGRTLEEIQERGWIGLIHPDDFDETLGHWTRLIAGSGGYDTVNRLMCSDGQYRWFHTSVAVCRDERGQTIAFHGVMLDTTAQKTAEFALRESEQQMQKMMDTVPSILWSMTPDGKTMFINKKAREYLGMSLQQIQEWGWVEAVHPEEQAVVVRELKTALETGRCYGAEHRIRRQDGTYRWHLSAAEPLRDASGQIVQWFGVDIDIDDQKLAEGRLRKVRSNLSQTSRASTVAELSASIAHELNQPLTSLLANAQACSRWLVAAPPNMDEAIASVERIVRDSRAADAVLRNIRSLFKQQPSIKTPLNFIELIREAVGLVEEDANRRSILIEWDYENPVVMVPVDRFQIQQIIINLVCNAIDAMQGVDRVHVLRIRVRNMNNGHVLTEFIDNGRGLPDGDAEKIFDAFVTTKTDGMGIGLAISRSIVEAHDGQLWGENNPDFGAKFSLLLQGIAGDGKAGQS
jgi:PAS domain S-box-containing protein